MYSRHPWEELVEKDRLHSPSNEPKVTINRQEELKKMEGIGLSTFLDFMVDLSREKGMWMR